jgi:hypothetical protein
VGYDQGKEPLFSYEMTKQVAGVECPENEIYSSPSSMPYKKSEDIKCS